MTSDTLSIHLVIRMPVTQWSCVRMPEHELMNTVLCEYCRENQAQFIPSGALGPCCGNPFLPRIHGTPSSCWEQAKKEGWPKFNQRYFENNWEAKMKPLRKSSENHTLRALDPKDCELHLWLPPENDKIEIQEDFWMIFWLYRKTKVSHRKT